MLTALEAHDHLVAHGVPAPGFTPTHVSEELHRLLVTEAQNLVVSLFPADGGALPEEGFDSLEGKAALGMDRVHFLSERYGSWVVRTVLAVNWALLCGGYTAYRDALGSDRLGDLRYEDSRTLVRMWLLAAESCFGTQDENERALFWTVPLGVLWSASEEVKEEFTYTMLHVGGIGALLRFMEAQGR